MELVGFRSTRLRTPYNSLVTIPNSVLANMAIDNYGMRRARRYRTFLQIVYGTPIEKIEAYCEGVRSLINSNPLIQKDNAIVTLHEMNTSSLDILLTVFFITDVYRVELRERHKLITDILKLAEDQGITFAYPTQTILLEQSKLK